MKSPSEFPLTLTVDDYACTYLEQKRLVDQETKVLKEKKAELLKLVRKEGTVPAGAEKSLRIEGDDYVITASFGTSSSIDNDVVGEIQAELAKARQPRLFRKLFQTHTSYMVSPMAPTVLASCSAAVRKLFLRVVTTKPKEPSLTVEKKSAKGKK